MSVDPKYEQELQEALAAQPSLSWLDRGIWLAGTAVSWVVSALLWKLHTSAIANIRDMAPEALAAGETWSIFLGLPGMLFPIMIGMFCLFNLRQKTALFGWKGAVYNGSTHRDLVVGYPLFMDLSEAPEEVRKRVRKERKNWMYIGIALAVCLYLFTWSLNGRQVVQPDGSVQVYNGRGELKQEYSSRELERFTVRISAPYSGRYDSQENHELDFLVRFTDGTYFEFRMEQRTGDELRYLCQLLELKEQVGPEVFRAEDEELLESLNGDHGWTGKAAELARSLFSTPEK